jgi:broad specificity phosphatase PhoE
VPTILLIRHGQASYGADDYDRLSEVGHAQASAVAVELRRRGARIERIVHGSLARQRDTAAPTVAALSLPAVLDPSFNEYDIDEIVSRHTDSPVRTNAAPGGEPVSSREFQRILEMGMNAWIDAGDDEDHDDGDGDGDRDDDDDGDGDGDGGDNDDGDGDGDGSGRTETWPAFESRCRAGLSAVATGLTSGSTAAVFTSGGVIASLCCSLLGLGPKTLIALNRVAVNGGLTKVASGRSGLSLVSFNEHGYLEGAGPGLVTLR